MWLPTRQLAWVCCLRLNADQMEAMSTSLSLNQQQLEIVMLLWARDEDVPARSIRLVVELVRRNLQVQFLCGTRQCLRALAAQSIAAHALRVPALWRASGALAPIANQQELAKMKLRLPGVAFEDAITTLTALAALAQPALPSKSVRVYLDPLAVLLGGVEPFLQWALAPDGGRPSRILLAKGIQASIHCFAINTRANHPAWLSKAMQALLRELSTAPHHEIRAPPPRSGWEARALCDARAACMASGGIIGNGSRSDQRRSLHLIEYQSQGCKGEMHVGDVMQTLAVLPYVPRVDGFVDHFVQQRGPQMRLPCKGESNAWPRPGPPGSRAFVVLAARFSSLFSAEPPPHVEPVLVGYRVEGVPANVDAASLPWLRAAFRKIPIGTRDGYVARILRRVGVNASVSGCVTLSLRTLMGPPRCPSHALSSLECQQQPVLSFTRGYSRTQGLTASDFRRAFPNATERRFELLTHSYQTTHGAITRSGGVEYQLSSRVQRQQFALDRLRVMHNASALVTKNFFHVLMPAAGMGVASLSSAWPPHNCLDDERHDGDNSLNRFSGLSKLYLGRTGSCSQHPSLPLSRELARLLPDLSGGQSTFAGIQPGLESMRSELVDRQLWMFAQHAPLLDAMHRLGAVGDVQDGNAHAIAAADAAWRQGRLPNRTTMAKGQRVPGAQVRLRARMRAVTHNSAHSQYGCEQLSSQPTVGVRDARGSPVGVIAPRQTILASSSATHVALEPH